MQKITLKTEEELKVMAEGGKKLGKIKNELKDAVVEGKNAEDLENLAQTLIKQAGGKPSFAMVPGYRWATCVNVNTGLVHGIPKAEIVFKKGDVVSVDVGLYYKGFHTDTSFTSGVGIDTKKERFLAVGRQALRRAINKAKAGNRVFDIASAIEKTVSEAGLSPIRALVGHGVGRSLHEEPQIPCFTQGAREESPQIVAGMALAIEVMYAQGEPDVVLSEDGWTIAMRDGKISGLFEETVAIYPHGPVVLTK